MTNLRLRTVDAFADRAFTGNPAGVLRLDGRPPVPESWLAAIAAELNLAETAFVLDAGEAQAAGADFGLRWFTPAVEVDLCGHATLAAAHCLFGDGVASPVRFATRSGVLAVALLPDGSLELDFPSRPAQPIEPPAGLLAALGLDLAHTVWVGRGGTDDLLVEVRDAGIVGDLAPDSAALARLRCRGVIVTAASDLAGVDFVSRFFAPAVGVAEDPVTGSAHTVLAPYWQHKLGRAELVGRQLSARSGSVGVRVLGERVALRGRAVTILDGSLSAAAGPEAAAEWAR